MQNKFEILENYLNKLDEQGISLAFSGGIDSLLLLYLCKNKNVKAYTFKSVFQTDEEIDFTKDICKEFSVEQEIIQYYPLEDELIKNNPKDRCYYCKKLMFSLLAKRAGKTVIIDGTNADDLNCYRPGLKALKELGIISPFAECGITKEEIREYTKRCGIKYFSKPSTPCFATRFPYNTLITENDIEKVKSAEKILQQNGFASCRVRLHNDIARIEINPNKFNEIIKKKDLLIKQLKKIGITYITLDLEGFRSGSMDIELK